MASRASLRITLISIFLVVFGTDCAAPPAQQKTATYVATAGNETDRLQITVTRNSLVLAGYFEVSVKQSDGTVKVRRTAITGDVSTDGVPSTITIPSSIVGVPDLTLGCFFDGSLNLQLVGDNRRPYPRLMLRVK